MSEILNRIAKAIHDATEKPKYVVKIGKQWELWTGDKLIASSENHTHMTEVCEQLNTRYVARKAVEALKGEVPYYETNKMWRELTSTDVWNLCLDKILAE